MKKIVLMMLLLLPLGAWAQDVIVKKDGSTVVCRVEKVSDTDVTYKLWSDLKGSSYIIDKSLVSAINYESGKKETFGETTGLYTPTSLKNSEQTVSDKELMRIDWATNKQKVKRLRTWGWIGGGVLAAAGIALVVYGEEITGKGEPEYSGTGGALIALGAVVTTICLVRANKEKKKIDAALQTSSIYRYDIPFSNGSSLSVGADMLNDRIMDKRTVGLGLSYNF